MGEAGSIVQTSSKVHWSKQIIFDFRGFGTNLLEW